MMHKLTLADGRAIYVEPSAITAVYVGSDGKTRIAVRGASGSYRVSDPVEEVVRLIEEAAHPTTDAACAAVVDAARRLIAWLDDSGATYAAHEAIVHDLRTALAAMEVPRG